MQQIWPRLEQRALTLLWYRTAAQAQDMTAATVGRSCLILAPHPDDETLGCGGLALLKRAAGTRVDVIIATDGGATHPDTPARSLGRADVVALRAAETRAACAALGIGPAHLDFLGYPDGVLASRAADLQDSLAAAITRIAPDEVYVCALADGHRDHVALAQAARSLAAEGRLGGADLWEYPVWYWDFRSWRPPGTSNKRGFLLGLAAMYRALRDTPVAAVSIRGLEARKRAALECHRSQLGLLAAEPDWEGLPERFLSVFFRDRELFFQVSAEVGLPTAVTAPT